ncbi:MAG: HmuY family protein [Bacteroidota bacterium]
MEKIYSLLFFSVMFSWTVSAQFDQVSVGTSYLNQTFYKISDGSTSSASHDTWDIAFNVSLQGSGIWVNEGVGLAMGPPLPQVNLFLTGSSDFSNVDTTGMVQIFNYEVNWDAGAFNHVASEANPFDLGWGSYNPGNNQVMGTRIFVIKLRNGDYKKIEIQSLAGGVYTFRYADLDGSNEVIETCVKSNYDGTMAYYSIQNGDYADIEPTEWDMVFTRYWTILEEGTPYLVTGVLSNEGVEVAQADGIDPMTVDHNTFADSYSDSLTIIGSDWKEFILAQFEWVLVEDRVYFVKTTESELWQIQFIDFMGSSTGTTTLEKTFLTLITNIEDQEGPVNSFSVFPNPATDYINMAIELDGFTGDATYQLVNPLGQTVIYGDVSVNDGLNVKTLNIDLPSGIYILTLNIENQVISKQIIIGR